MEHSTRTPDVRRGMENNAEGKRTGTSERVLNKLMDGYECTLARNCRPIDP